MRDWIRSLLCKHNYIFMRNIYGDEIIHSGYKRSIWTCSACGKLKFRDALHEE